MSDTETLNNQTWMLIMNNEVKRVLSAERIISHSDVIEYLEVLYQ